MNKNILITGATDGIGKLVAITFAKKGHKIYLHGRNPEKLKALVSEIKSLTKNDSIKSFVADFSDIKAVKKMADSVNSELESLDILINNAGIFNSPTNKSKDGFDIRFSVNYFAPYLLTNALLPLLNKVSGSRIINLSSAAQAPVSLEALSGKKEVTAQEAYAQSKLALTAWGFRLAKTLEKTIVIAVNPGSLLNTKMANDAYGQHWAPADKGANILYDLASADEYKESNGLYFDNDKGDAKGYFSKAHASAYNENETDQLIELTAALLK